MEQLGEFLRMANGRGKEIKKGKAKMRTQLEMRPWKGCCEKPLVGGITKERRKKGRGKRKK